MTASGKTWKLSQETKDRQKKSWTPERRERLRQRMIQNNPHKPGKPVLGNRDENHWSWKGDEVGYISLHRWVARRLGKSKTHVCKHCGAVAHDWANISREYRRDLTDWMPLCRACHQIYDDIKARSWVTRKARADEA